MAETLPDHQNRGARSKQGICCCDHSRPPRGHACGRSLARSEKSDRISGEGRFCSLETADQSQARCRDVTRTRSCLPSTTSASPVLWRRTLSAGARTCSGRSPSKDHCEAAGSWGTDDPTLVGTGAWPLCGTTKAAPQPSRLVDSLSAGAMGGGRAQRDSSLGGVESPRLLWIDAECLSTSRQMARSL